MLHLLNSEINHTQVGISKDIDVAMPMYNLTDYINHGIRNFKAMI